MVRCLRDYWVALMVGMLLLGLGDYGLAQPPPGFNVGLAMLGKSGFGVTSLNSPEGASLSPMSFNPASLAAGVVWDVRQGVELDWGAVDFDEGPTVEFNMQTLMFTRRNVVFRVRRYGVTSGQAPVRFTRAYNYDVEFDGTAYEIAAGMPLGSNTWGGIAWVPSERVTTMVTTRGLNLAEGRGRSSLQLRAGILQQKKRQEKTGERLHWVYGLVLSYERARTKTSNTEFLNPIPFSYSGRFRQFSITPGVIYYPSRYTKFFLNYQLYRLSSSIHQVRESTSESLNIFYFGVERNLGARWSVSAGSLYNSILLGVNFTEGDKFQAGVSYSANGFRGVKDALGRGNMLFAYTWARW